MLINRVLHGFAQFLENTEVICDPTIEECSSTAEVQPFEDYEEYNRFMMQMSGFLAITPLFLFIYPTWVLKSDAGKEVVIAEHKPYLAVWALMISEHLFLYGPLLFLGISLQG